MKKNRQTYTYTGPSLEEQTKMSWATLLTRYEEVPQEFKFFYDPLQAVGRPFPYSVVTPSFEGFLHKFREKLVCLIEDEITIIDKHEIPDRQVVFNLHNLRFICFTSILLDSNLHLNGLDQTGKDVAVDLHFNTVSDYLFKPVINKIRQSNFTHLEARDDFSFTDLEAESYKFANFCRHSLLPGEKLLHLIWQPELRVSLIHSRLPLLFRNLFHRLVFTNHAIMLTDQELILIREDERHKHSDRYGGIWEYLPLKWIKEAALKPGEEGLLNLVITLANGNQVESLFIPSMRPEVDTLIEKLNNSLF